MSWLPRHSILSRTRERKKIRIVQRAGTDLLQADEYLARVGVRSIPEQAKE